MNKDKALYKVINRDCGELPFNFEQKVMQQVMMQASRKARRESILSMTLVAAVSSGMLAGLYFVLEHFYQFNIFSVFSKIQISIHFNPLYTWYIFIAVLMLVLLVMDYTFRHAFRKPEP